MLLSITNTCHYKFALFNAIIFCHALNKWCIKTKKEIFNVFFYKHANHNRVIHIKGRTITHTRKEISQLQEDVNHFVYSLIF